MGGCPSTRTRSKSPARAADLHPTVRTTPELSIYSRVAGAGPRTSGQTNEQLACQLILDVSDTGIGFGFGLHGDGLSCGAGPQPARMEVVAGVESRFDVASTLNNWCSRVLRVGALLAPGGNTGYQGLAPGSSAKTKNRGSQLCAPPRSTKVTAHHSPLAQSGTPGGPAMSA